MRAAFLAGGCTGFGDPLAVILRALSFRGAVAAAVAAAADAAQSGGGDDGRLVADFSWTPIRHGESSAPDVHSYSHGDVVRSGDGEEGPERFL